jgi:hypothetical protein
MDGPPCTEENPLLVMKRRFANDIFAIQLQCLSNGLASLRKGCLDRGFHAQTVSQSSKISNNICNIPNAPKYQTTTRLGLNVCDKLCEGTFCIACRVHQRFGTTRLRRLFQCSSVATRASYQCTCERHAGAGPRL